MESWLELVKIFAQRHDLLFCAEIEGGLPSGKNNYRISGRGMFRNRKVINYEDHFLTELMVLKLKKRHKMIKDPVALVAQVWFKDMRRDVDTILLCDLLQKGGVIENDRQIRIKLINGLELDDKKPRVEFGLYRLGGGENGMAGVP